MIKRTYDLEDRLIDFVLKIDQLVELLPNTRGLQKAVKQQNPNSQNEN